MRRKGIRKFGKSFLYVLVNMMIDTLLGVAPMDRGFATLKLTNPRHGRWICQSIGSSVKHPPDY